MCLTDIISSQDGNLWREPQQWPCASKSSTFRVISLKSTSNIVWTAFREEVQHLAELCSDNNLNLKTTKTKEVIIDFRKTRRFEHSVLCIRREGVERVESLHLTWCPDIAHHREVQRPSVFFGPHFHPWATFILINSIRKQLKAPWTLPVSSPLLFKKENNHSKKKKKNCFWISSRSKHGLQHNPEALMWVLVGVEVDCVLADFSQSRAGMGQSQRKFSWVRL